jgi:hypothetical protein
MGYETDQRFNPARFRNPDKDPNRFNAEGRSNDDAFRRAAFEESQNRQQYEHGVVVGTSPRARIE